MNNPFLIGERIYLRALRLNDLEGGYLNWLNDAEVCAHNGHHVCPYLEEDLKKYIESSWGQRDKIVLAIVKKNDDKHIGNICMQNINLLDRSAQLTIILGDKEEWGNGYGREAWTLLMEHGFKALNLHRIYCGTFSTNIGMQKLAESVGMKKEGTRKEAHYKNGRFCDLIEYGIISEEK